jgi:hypothetical protein
VFVWTTSDKPVELVAKFGGACVQRAEDPAWLDERKLDWFVFNAPGRDDLHLDRENPKYQERWKRWCDTRDPTLLVREPCLASPVTRERLDRLLDESLKARGGRTGLGVSLGDEIGLTPGGVPDDVCQCELCEKAWSEFRVARGLKPDVKLADISTDATLKALERGETTAIGPWLLRREFHEQQTFDVIAELAARVREKSPGTPVGLLGLTAQSAFGSVSIERVLPLLDFVECYRVGNARELALTLRKPEQRVLLTVFDDPRGPDFAAWQAWEHWMRGGDGLVIWSERELTKKPALRERLARAVRDIRAVQAQVGRFRPEPQGFAVVHSQASVAVSWLREAASDGSTWPKRFPSYQEEHGELEKMRKRLFEYHEDAGRMPGALPLELVGAQTAQRFQFLELPRLLLVDEAELQGLRAFSDAGGEVSADTDFAWIDSSGELVPRKRSVPALRVGDLAAARTRLAAACRPWTVAGTGEGVPWLATWARGDDATVCAMLPRSTLDASAASLSVDTLEIAPRDETLRVEWIHPKPDEQGTVRLPAGDAAVFRLVPRQR